MPERIISCRTASYGDYEACAREHLASLGIKCVEMLVPAPDQIQAAADELGRWGLRATTLHSECDIKREDFVSQIEAQMPAFKALGTKLMFISCGIADTPVETAYQRLRAAGDVVAKHGVTMVAETHPELFSNGDVALQTMQAVDHPNVRVNYDTANVYYYNHNIDAVEELRKILPYVGAVHLKDTSGEYHTWNFPALGRGVVDFPRIFELLDSVDFTGPFTMEIEGIEGEQKSERLTCDRIAESVGYLRGLGILG